MSAPKNKWLIFLIVSGGVFISTLDSSMVNIALPTIMAEFHGSLRHTQWVVMIYLLTITASLLFWGHLSDRIGRGPIYTAGLLAFGLGSLACAYAPTLYRLIFFRLAQAVGGAMMMATGPAIIRESFPKEELGRGLGLIGVAVSLGLMSGPTIGGFLIEYASWRSLFLITVPVALGLSVFGRSALPGRNGNANSIDWPGAILWSLALVLLALSLSRAADPAGTSGSSLLMLAASGMVLWCFAKIEARITHPLLRLRLVKKRFFAAAVASAALSFVLLFGVILLTPFYLDKIQNLPASRIGLVMMAIPSSLMIVAPLAGWLADRLDARILTTAGLAVSTAGTFLLSRLTPQSGPFHIAIWLAFLGCGQALFLSPNSASVLGRVEKSMAGAAAAMLATARNLGMLLGIALAALVFSHSFGSLTNGLDMKDFSAANTGAFIMAIHNAFLAAGFTGIMAIIVSIWRGNSMPNIRRN